MKALWKFKLCEPCPFSGGFLRLPGALVKSFYYIRKIFSVWRWNQRISAFQRRWCCKDPTTRSRSKWKLCENLSLVNPVRFQGGFCVAGIVVFRVLWWKVFTTYVKISRCGDETRGSQLSRGVDVAKIRQLEVVQNKSFLKI